MTLSRRQFLQLGIGALTVGGATWAARAERRDIPGSIVGANFARGHALRSGKFPEPNEEQAVPLLIVGGGMSGLSAGWWLQRSGFRDFVITELDTDVGGNSRSGENRISGYPWGAHYVPVPGKETSYLHALFEELGVITGRDSQGMPIYREEYLCQDPEERLYIRGRWQSGLVPSIGLSPTERSETDRFFAAVEELKHARGADGLRAFVVPIELSSRDPQFLALDRRTFADYLDSEGYHSEPLRWYLNYCCLDDYGAPANAVSAWAGLHYFAGRGAWAANVSGYDLITWPEGNGWIVKRLKQRLADQIRTDGLVYRIRQSAGDAEVDVFLFGEQRSKRYRAKAVIFSAPRFTAPYIFGAGLPYTPEYHPWMVANLSLDGFPERDEVAWDNVIYQGGSLGYVSANHQQLEQQTPQRVITFYQPLWDSSGPQARKRALTTPHREWTQQIVRELKIPHHGIERYVRQIDVWLWGHGMACPSPDYIWSKKPKEFEQDGRVLFAHSDMSGISMFEEAQYRGVEAAKRALTLVS